MGTYFTRTYYIVSLPGLGLKLYCQSAALNLNPYILIFEPYLMNSTLYTSEARTPPKTRIPEAYLQILHKSPLQTRTL